MPPGGTVTYTLTRSQMFYQLFFLHSAAVTEFLLFWIMCLFSSDFYYEQFDPCCEVWGSAVSQTVHVCDWSYSVRPRPFHVSRAHTVKHVFTCNSSKSTCQVSTLHFDMQRTHTELLACSFQHVNMKQRGSCSTSEQDWSPCCSFYWMCCITDSQLMKWVSVTLMSSSLNSWRWS